MNEEILTVADYMTMPLIELASHPDFDLEVFQVIANLAKIAPSKSTYFAASVRGYISTKGVFK